MSEIGRLCSKCPYRGVKDYGIVQGIDYDIYCRKNDKLSADVKIKECYILMGR